MNTIIRITLLEMRKKKILYLTLLLTFIFLGIYGTALYFTYGESWIKQDNMARMFISGQFVSMGIYVTGLITAFLSIFSSIGIISSEIEQGNLDAILAKPISRYEIVVGKFIGILLLLIPYITFLYSSVVGLNMLLGKGVVVKISIAAFLESLGILYMLPILLGAIGIFFSTFMSTMGSGITLVILYFCGMVGGILEQVGRVIQIEQTKMILTNIGVIISLIIPSDIVYRKASSLLFTTSSGMNLTMEGMLGAQIQPSKAMLVYIGIYSIAMVILAIRKFQKRDL